MVVCLDALDTPV